MSTTQVFLAWSKLVPPGTEEALTRALDAVKRQLNDRGYSVYDWSQEQHIRNIGSEMEDQLHRSDLVILEGSSGRPNLAFEVGFARCADLPVIIFKQEGSADLPEDFGAPKYLRYPADASREKEFERFTTDLKKLLDTLESTLMSHGHRELRRARYDFQRSVQQILDSYSGEHANLYLTEGWVKELAREINRDGPSVITADSEYYVRMFNALQKRTDVNIRAIADLTDNIEPFWTSDEPEPLSTSVGERIFLIDWRMFFEREEELTRLMETWRTELIRNEGYKIYVATESDIDPRSRHPFGNDTAGLNLLLVEPDGSFGGYRKKGSRGEQQFSMERDRHRYENAKAFYESVLEAAVPLDPDHDFVALKRAWLLKHRIGYWDTSWTSQTERRPPSYFDRYDQHIRCWIPPYNELISRCAAVVAREVLHIHQGTGKPVDLLEIGYGTGSLTANIVPWIQHLGEPSKVLRDLPPVDRYHAVDRAGQMLNNAEKRLGPDAHARVLLLRNIAWREIREDIRYDVIFGSLVTHFMIDRDEDLASADAFFAECSKRLRPGGSLIFSDSFGIDSSSDLTSPQAVRRWRESMVSNGLSDEYADNFLAGNMDMQNSLSFKELGIAAAHHDLVAASEHLIGDTPIFKVVVFRKPDHDAGGLTAAAT